VSRLVRSHLVERAPADRLVDVVREVCGIHAQVMGSAELQLAARVDGITQADVREALWERRELVKTWTLRGTLHIHPADELGLWTAARRALPVEADRVVAGLENVDEVVAAIGEALRGRQLTREQKVTFVHPDDWLGRTPSWKPEEALREVALRYSATYGPVTHREFRQWFGSRERSFEDLSLPEPRESVATTQSVRLLPEYDVYVMGYRDREAFVPPAVREQIKVHGKGRYEGPAGTPFLVVDGVCAGIWRRRKTAKRIELTVEPARKLTRAERAGVDAEAERIGAFLGLEPRLTIDR
jgi:hypothetical protein